MYCNWEYCITGNELDIGDINNVDDDQNGNGDQEIDDNALSEVDNQNEENEINQLDDENESKEKIRLEQVSKIKIIIVIIQRPEEQQLMSCFNSFYQQLPSTSKVLIVTTC